MFCAVASVPGGGGGVTGGEGGGRIGPPLANTIISASLSLAPAAFAGNGSPSKSDGLDSGKELVHLRRRYRRRQLRLQVGYLFIRCLQPGSNIIMLIRDCCFHLRQSRHVFFLVKDTPV